MNEVKTKTIGFIPCYKRMFAVFVEKDGSVYRAEVHAFMVTSEMIGDAEAQYLEPLVITERDYLSICDEDKDFVGFFDETDSKETIDYCVKQRLEELRKEDATTQSA